MYAVAIVQLGGAASAIRSRPDVVSRIRREKGQTASLASSESRGTG